MIAPIQFENSVRQIQFQRSISNRSYSEILAEEIGSTFEDQWRQRFSGFYHVMETSSISKWNQRLDFPFEKFFTDQVDPSILNWQPTSTNPSMLDSKVQSRLNSTLGKHVLIVPPSLDEKLKSDPKLAAKVMEKIDRAFEFNRTPIGRLQGSIIMLDDAGEISYGRFNSGGRITRSSERKNFMEEFWDRFLNFNLQFVD